ncbi:Uu.00g127180.m01.CDS01 [Anthostomella pinea]|uniref:Uu.00g127180.m01.CDS01 n=1 Tax=Anthostomella pinea TaxID=933095 RepID=A0AAI8YHV1_9PEZI|nr:Uu.00g127180.m01.CDS01 [Anthostomella pinea]
MCKELFERWEGCTCWGFVEPERCDELFKKCMGPRGDIDKKVIKWNDGMCDQCWDRLMLEAREMNDAKETAAAPASSSSHSTGS